MSWLSAFVSTVGDVRVGEIWQLHADSELVAVLIVTEADFPWLRARVPRVQSGACGSPQRAGCCGSRSTALKRGAMPLTPDGLGYRFWLIAFCVLLGGAATGALVTLGITQKYRATAVVVINVAPYKGSSSCNDTNDFMLCQTVTLTSLVTSPAVLDDLGLPISASRLRGETSTRVAVVGQGSQSIAISVTDPDPGHAAEYANAVANRYSHYITSLYRAADAIPPRTAVQTRTATPPSNATGRPWARNEILGALAGLLATLAVPVARIAFLLGKPPVRA